ncbi:MAG: BrnA antitoxin family protein [bacterium]|nr:BrnA antitoxin family protein [bacterium]
MREDYELTKLKVKRRGPLPGLAAGGDRPPKVRITIALDQDLIDHFKTEAAKPGGLPYQTQINQALRRAIDTGEASLADAEAIKAALLEDVEFLETLARKIRAA